MMRYRPVRRGPPAGSEVDRNRALTLDVAGAHGRATRALAIGAAAGTVAALLGCRWLAASTRSDAEITYAPLDTPKSIARDLWIVDSGPISAGGLKLPLRMVVVRLSSGDLWLHSPTRLTSGLNDQLRALGPVRHLVAPTFAHWTFLRDWQSAFPDATTWAAPRLRGRRQVRAAGIRIDADLGEHPPALWAGDLEQGIVRGAANFSEVYFFHKPSGSLLLSDLIENLELAKLSPLPALAMRVAGATRATTALHVRTILARHAREARRQVTMMQAFAPKRVIFAHGRWFDEDAPARLERAFAWLPSGEDAGPA